MSEDIYLNLATELYEKGTWDYETFKKKVMLYAKDKNIDINVISEFLKRVTNIREYSIDEKRKFLSILTFDGNELKYGNVLEEMDEVTIEKLYEMETSLLDEDMINKYHDLAKDSIEKEVVKRTPIIVKPKKVLRNLESVKKVEKKQIEVADILNGNYTEADLLGINENEKIETFNRLLNSVTPENFNAVIESLKLKAGTTYSRDFAIEWAKMHSVNLEENKEEIIDVDDSLVDNEKKDESNDVIPEFSFNEEDTPQTDEEYVEQAKKTMEKESDSSVKNVDASQERINKLKKNKGKIKNYFLKTTMVILAVTLLTPSSLVVSVGGYLYFANKIKNGQFNPENAVGKAIKSAVEKVMYIGMNKEEIERGKSK